MQKLILIVFIAAFSLSSLSAHAKRYTVCEELKKSITYPGPEDAGKMKRKLIYFKTAYTGVKEVSKVVLSAGLGLTGLPISVGFNLLFQAMKIAGVELGKNKRQMLATITVSEALLNDEIDIYGHFGKADLLVFEDFLSAKREFNRLIVREIKKSKAKSKTKITDEEKYSMISNIAFAKLVVELENYEGYFTNEDGTEEFISGNDFYCKKYKSGRVKFRGFSRKSRDLLYKYYIQSKKLSL